MAVASVVLAGIGFCTVGLAGVVGLALGIAALVAIGERAELGGRGLAVAGIAVSGISFIVGPFLAGILLPAFVGAAENARQNLAVTALHELALGTYGYAADHDDALPPSADWVGALAGYVENLDDLLVSPFAPEAGRGYAMNGSLDGATISGVGAPHRTVLFFEAVPDRAAAGGPELLPRRPRHRWGYAIIFVDGHAESVPAQHTETLVWEP